MTSKAEIKGGDDHSSRNESLGIKYGGSLSYTGGYKLDTKTYITGRLGYALASVESVYDDKGATPLCLENTKVLHGVITGVGVEYLLNETVSLGLEYRYTHYLDGIKLVFLMEIVLKKLLLFTR